MSESLDDFPAVFMDSEPMPWDAVAGERYIWLWGADRGRALEEIDSRELLRKRRWLEERSGVGRCYHGLVQEIDKELISREGE